MLVTLRFENRTAAECNDSSANDAEAIELRVSRDAVPHIMAWYGAYYAGDDYEVFINGREVGKDRNGEFEPPTIEAGIEMKRLTTDLS